MKVGGTELSQHLSWTQLNMMLRCGEQYNQRYVNGFKVRPNKPMIVGSGLDASANLNLGHFIEAKEYLPLGEVQEAAFNEVNKRWDEDGVELTEQEKAEGEKKVRGDAADMAVQLATCHHEVVAPEIEPVSVQREIETTLGGYDLTLLCYIDVMEKHGFRELKSSARAWSQDTADTNGQITAYSLSVLAVDKYIPPVTIDVIKKLKKGPEYQKLTTSRSNDDFFPFLRLIEAAIRNLERGNFFPDGLGTWVCPPERCGFFKSRCRYVNAKRRPLN